MGALCERVHVSYCPPHLRSVVDCVASRWSMFHIYVFVEVNAPEYLTASDTAVLVAIAHHQPPMHIPNIVKLWKGGPPFCAITSNRIEVNGLVRCAQRER